MSRLFILALALALAGCSATPKPLDFRTDGSYINVASMGPDGRLRLERVPTGGRPTVESDGKSLYEFIGAPKK